MASYIKRKSVFVTFCVLTVIWMGVIFYFSSQDATDSSVTSQSLTEKILMFLNPKLMQMDVFARQGAVDGLEKIVRKCAHALIFALLGMFCHTAVESSNMTRGVQGVFLSLLICCAYATSDEIHQLFVPGRSGQVSDVLIDTLGSLAGIALVFSVYKIFQKKQRQ